MFKKVLILILTVFLINTKCFANTLMEQIYDNISDAAYNICYDEGDKNENFKKLENNVRSISKEDIEDFRNETVSKTTGGKGIKIKLNALADAMNEYINISESCCINKVSNGKTLMKMYLKNLKKYN